MALCSFKLQSPELVRLICDTAPRAGLVLHSKQPARTVDYIPTAPDFSLEKSPDKAFLLTLLALVSVAATPLSTLLILVIKNLIKTCTYPCLFTRGRWSVAPTRAALTNVPFLYLTIFLNPTGGGEMAFGTPGCR